MEDQDDGLGWKRRGACLGVDPELFFPEKGINGSGSVEQAKAVCRGCSVREDCLEYALANGEKFGVWGGLTERERRVIARRRRLIARGRVAAVR